jgi:hypothetical protein
MPAVVFRSAPLLWPILAVVFLGASLLLPMPALVFCRLPLASNGPGHPRTNKSFERDCLEKFPEQQQSPHGNPLLPAKSQTFS